MLKCLFIHQIYKKYEKNKCFICNWFYLLKINRTYKDMRVLTGFTYFSGVQSVVASGVTISSSSVNKFNFPLDITEYGEEVFEIGAKYGPYCVASGDVSETMIDWKVDYSRMDDSVYNTAIAGTMRVVNSANTSMYVDIDITYSSDLSMAKINQLAWKACNGNYTLFNQLNTIYWLDFGMSAYMIPYYKGTLDIVEEIGVRYFSFSSPGTNMTMGGTLYNKERITITCAQTNMGLTTKSQTVKCTEIIKLIPKLKPFIKILGLEQSRFQEILGINSIYAILDRLTAKYTKNLATSGATSYSTPLLHHPSYGVDYKVILVETALGGLRDAGASIPTHVSTNVYNTLTTSSPWVFDVEYLGYYNKSGESTQAHNIIVHLFDEDEYILNRTTNIGLDFIMPPPISVFDFNLTSQSSTINDYSPNTLDIRTNGLITNIIFGFVNFARWADTPYFITTQSRTKLFVRNEYSTFTHAAETTTVSNNEFVLCNLDFQDDYGRHITFQVIPDFASEVVPPTNYSKEYLFSLNYFFVENFGVISNRFIVIDGIPRGCNDTHYLSGTMFIVRNKDINKYEKDAHLFIGVRKLNNHILNKITHYNNTSIDGGLFHVLMTSDSTSLIRIINTHTSTGVTMMNFSALTQYGTERTYYPISSDPVKSLRSYGDSISTVMDIARSEIAYLTPSTYVANAPWGNNGLDEALAASIESGSQEVDETTSTTGQEFEEIQENGVYKNRYSLEVKYSNIFYKDSDYNIRVMIYPTFLSSATTNVNYYSGICISLRYDTTRNTKGNTFYMLRFNNSSQYNTVLEQYLSNKPFNISLLNTVGRYLFYCDGVFTGDPVNIDTASGPYIKRVKYGVPYVTYNKRYVDCSIPDTDLQPVGDIMPRNDTLTLRNGSHGCYKMITSDDNPIGSVKCSTVMKLNFKTFLYYIDVSLRIQIASSGYRNAFDFSDNFLETLRVTISNAYIGDLEIPVFQENNNTRDGDPMPIAYINNGMFIANFRINEQCYYPFNMVSKTSFPYIIKFTFVLKNKIDSQNPNLECTSSFYLHGTCLNNNKTNPDYRDTGLFFCPSQATTNLITGQSTTNGLRVHVGTRYTGAFNSSTTGIRLVINNGNTTQIRCCSSIYFTTAYNTYLKYMLRDYNLQGAFIVFSVCFYKASSTELNLCPLAFYKGNTSSGSFNGIITSPNTNFYGAYFSYIDAKPGFYIYRIVHHLNDDDFAYDALIGPNRNNTTSTPDYINSFTEIFPENVTTISDFITRMKANNTLYTSLLLLSSFHASNDLYFKYLSIDGYVDYLPSNIDF